MWSHDSTTLLLEVVWAFVEFLYVVTPVVGLDENFGADFKWHDGFAEKGKQLLSKTYTTHPDLLPGCGAKNTVALNDG